MAMGDAEAPLARYRCSPWLLFGEYCDLGRNGMGELERLRSCSDSSAIGRFGARRGGSCVRLSPPDKPPFKSHPILDTPRPGGVK